MQDQLTDKVLIKIADPNDLPLVFSLVDGYCDNYEIDRVRVKNFLRDILYVRGVFMALYNGVPIGGVAGYAVPNMFQDELMFCAMFFYIDKEFRHLTSKFLEEFELCLLPTKCNRIIFGVMDTPAGIKQQRFLRMRGYGLLETHLSKRIG